MVNIVAYYTKGLTDLALAEVEELARAATVVEKTDRFAIIAIPDSDLPPFRQASRTIDDVRVLVGGPGDITSLAQFATLCKEAANKTVALIDQDGRAGSGDWSVTVSARNPVWRRDPEWSPAEVLARELHGADIDGRRRQPVDLRLQVDEIRAHVAVNLAAPVKRPGDGRPRPGALRPTVAAAMIRLATNGLPLTTTRLGIYDPFCGSGTIVAEATAAGLPVFGSDVDEQAVQMTRQRLAAIARDRHTAVVDIDSLNHRIFPHDVANSLPPRVSARVLVGNMPWGKQVRIDRHQELLDATSALVAQVLDKGGSAALLTTNEDRFVARLRKQAKRADVTVRRIGLLGQTPAIVSVTRARP